MKTKSNKIGDIVKYIHNELKNKYSKDEIQSFINILFEHFASMNSAHILAFPDETINESELLNIYLATEDLRKYRPIQYIIGEVDFLNIHIKINEQALIPRPETEELVQYIIDDCNKEKSENLNILDLCSGSGCISLALAKNFPNAEVTGIDISKDAIMLAKENSEKLQLNNAYFIEKDLLSTDFNLEEKYDIIVSNPPYVRESERIEIKNNVLDYEPWLALFVKDENPLIFYQKIEEISRKYLKNKGKIYLECNNFLAKQTEALFSQKEYFTEIKQDIFGKDRFIFIEKS